MLRKRIQLGLVHVAVAMTLVPINSTLNRVMIKEMGLAATLVAVLASLPYLFSPIQVAIGAFSDRHPVLGFRRTPYILAGLLLCAAGVVAAPYAAFLMDTQFTAGLALGVLTFGAWGMGFNLASVSYLSLASEISGEKGRSRTIAIMFFMMIVSIIFTAIWLSRLLEPYSPEVLARSFWMVAAAALVLGLVGLIRVEARSAPGEQPEAEERYSLLGMGRAIFQHRQVALFFWYLILLLAAILGQDVLLEPFAGEAFNLSVQSTTRITSLWGVCMLLALLAAGMLEGRVSKRRIAIIGAWGAVAAFVGIAASGVLLNEALFYSGVVLLGLATGLATVSNLSLMLDMTVAGKVGLFIGAWGMANAFSRLTGAVLAGVVRDTATRLAHSPVTGYVIVFILEALMLLISLWILRSIDVSAFHRQAGDLSVAERAALANEA